jgi:hypothetical protein
MIRKSLVGMASVLFLAFASSCSQDVINENESNNAEEGYLTLKLTTVGNSFTKATGDTDTTNQPVKTEDGTTAENTISSARVLLCKKGVDAIDYSYTVGIAKDENNVVTTDPFKIGVGEYDIYVIANPTSDVVIERGSTVDQAKFAVTAEKMKNNFAKDNTFIMFNEFDNTTGKTYKGTATVTSQNIKTNPAINATPIKLDRLSAKIIADTNGDTKELGAPTEAKEIIAKATLVDYTLINGAGTVMLAQPRYDESSKWIASSFNFGQDAATWKTSGFYNYVTEFYSLEYEDNGKYKKVTDIYNYDPNHTAIGSSTFCMENNPAQGGNYAKKGNTTGVIFKVKAEVDTEDGTFYKFNNEFFKSLDAIQNKYPTAFEVNGEADAAAQLATAKSDLASDVSTFRAKYNTRVFVGGTMYYTYYIKDSNYEKYLVARNSVYKINVTKLLLVGSDIPGSWTPENEFNPDPLDPEDPVENLYLQVQVTVNPWIISSQDVELD